MSSVVLHFRSNRMNNLALIVDFSRRKMDAIKLEMDKNDQYETVKYSPHYTLAFTMQCKTDCILGNT